MSFPLLLVLLLLLSKTWNVPSISPWVLNFSYLFTLLMILICLMVLNAIYISLNLISSSDFSLNLQTLTFNCLTPYLNIELAS